MPYSALCNRVYSCGDAVVVKFTHRPPHEAPSLPPEHHSEEESIHGFSSEKEDEEDEEDEEEVTVAATETVNGMAHDALFPCYSDILDQSQSSQTIASSAGSDRSKCTVIDASIALECVVPNLDDAHHMHARRVVRSGRYTIPVSRRVQCRLSILIWMPVRPRHALVRKYDRKLQGPVEQGDNWTLTLQVCLARERGKKKSAIVLLSNIDDTSIAVHGDLETDHRYEPLANPAPHDQTPPIHEGMMPFSSWPHSPHLRFILIRTARCIQAQTSMKCSSL